MKFLDNIYGLIKNITNTTNNKLEYGKFDSFDNSDFKEEKLKKNIFFSIVLLFFVFLFLALYIVFKNTAQDASSETEAELPPLKIVVPYPNSSINIDDYEILKYKVQTGDNLANIFTKEVGVSAADAQAIMLSIKPIYDLSQLKAGQTLNIKYRITIEQGLNDAIEEKVVIEEIRFDLGDREMEMVVNLDKNNKYVAEKNKINLNKNYLKYIVKINDSLFSDGVEAGVPPSIMLDFIKFFSFDIDFQRDLRKGDTFEVLFESYFTDDGKKVRDGDILYAKLNNQNKDFEMYRFSNNGNTNYYNKDGQSVQKSLLKTPINGARISSSYGMRRHPVLGYSKLHAGKDFAAPTGTPFFAAGSGTVVKAQFWSTWGNYVRIRHTSGYETEYAHASRIAPGIKPGVRVRQGQIIAYVGTTGRSTGPHLHFGVLFNNQRINPDRVKSLPSLKLFGKDLINFKNEVDRTDLYRSNIANQNLKLKK